MRKIFFIIILAFQVYFGEGFSQKYTIDVFANSPVATVQPTTYGVFFEDINFAGDGGLYAELIKNRSFEFDNPLMGWSTFGNVSVLNTSPCFSNNPNFVKLTSSGVLTGTGMENEGFAGIGFREKSQYNLSFFCRNVGNDSVKLNVSLLSSANDVLAQKNVTIGKNEDWEKINTTLVPVATEEYGRFRVMLIGEGSIMIDHISLFPAITYKNRPNGLRRDLAESLEELSPGFFRFPGGCIVEGTTLETRYQWKNTIGAVENRPTIINRWNYIFDYKRFTDYYQSFGLGFFEYFQLCEDIGAEPLPVVNCGLTCQWVNKGEEGHCPVTELQPFIQDALDLIEFANGTADSQWGKIRHDMGHPEPFNLKYLAVGNEQWGTQYSERLPQFILQIRKKYPEIVIIGSSGPFPDGVEYDFGWKEMRRLGVDLVDEHFYKDPSWFLSSASRYDKADRSGPAVFAGEYACHTRSSKNTFESALCEAAFLTGVERNADIVHMTAYAPLMAHVRKWQWRPDLIWFDNLNVLRTPNYYIQLIFSKNKGTEVIPATKKGLPLSGQDSLYLSAVNDKPRNEIIIKIVNVSAIEKDLTIAIQGRNQLPANASVTELCHTDPDAENSFDDPLRISPKTSSVKVKDAVIHLKIKPKSFKMIKL